MFPQTVKQVKRWLKIVVGFTLLGAGIIMLVLPGPGWLTIVMGLALLAAEFLWARRLLQTIKAKGAQLRDKGVQLRDAIRHTSPSRNAQTPANAPASSAPEASVVPEVAGPSATSAAPSSLSASTSIPSSTADSELALATPAKPGQDQ